MNPRVPSEVFIMPQPLSSAGLIRSALALADEGSIRNGAKALGLAPSTFQRRIDAARMVAASDAPDIEPKAADGPQADPIDLRRATDQASGLRVRNKELEQRLVEQEDWRAKFESLQRSKLADAKWLGAPAIRRKNVLTPVLFTSDFQVGEVIRPQEIDGINRYDQHVFVERYQLMIEKTIMLATQNTGATEFDHCVYLRGGDAISGEIHEELAETNDLSSIPAVRLLLQQEREGIRRLKAKFGRVRVYSIPGNHGRTTKKPHAKGYTERSYETLLAWWLAESFSSDPNVVFHQPPSGDALFDVQGWSYLLSHGDRMGSRGGQGFVGPAATIARGHQKLYANWTSTGRPVHCILTGHLHTSLKLERGYANGALAGYSEYARDFRATPAPPTQWLLFGHREHMVSHHFELQLGPRPTRTVVEGVP